MRGTRKHATKKWREGQQVLITAATALRVERTGLRHSHFFFWAGPAQLLSVFRNSPFSVICREEVLLGDRPFRWDVTA